MLLLILLVTAAAAFVLYYRIAFTYWKKKGVPTLNPVVPFGDFFKALLPGSSPALTITHLYKQFEGHPFGGVYRFHKPNLLVRDPDVIKDVLIKDFDSFYHRGIRPNVDAEPLQGHLFALSGIKWRNLRVKLTPTFTSGKMKMMFPTLAETGKKLEAHLGDLAAKKEVFEIKDVLARFSTDIIASCAFGIQCDSLKNPDSEFRVWGRRIFTPSMKLVLFRFVTFFFPALNKYLKLSFFPKDVSFYFRNMVRETVEYREKNDVHRNDFLQLLIQMKNKTLGVVHDDELLKLPNGVLDGLRGNAPFEVTMDVMAAQAFVFFVAGFETSSTTMTFCLYELAVNPDIQDRVRDEILSVLNKHGGELTYDVINEMEYLDKVVNETLRKYPPVPILTRECTRNTKLRDSNVTVETGTPILLPIMGIHHDPKYYPDPERFDPERFSEEERKKRPACSFIPFGEGPRICIGMRFGLMQSKVGLISVLSKYEVKASEKTPIPLVFDPKSLVLAPKGGMWLQIVEKGH